MSFIKNIKLKYAISFFVILAAFCTTIVNWYSSFHALRITLTEYYLDSNYQYAQKIALTTDDLLLNIQKNISSLANIQGQHELNQEELVEWKNTYSSYFNSIFTTDSNGVVQIVSPLDEQSKVHSGTKIVSDLMKDALENRKPFISRPYLAQTGNLMLLISSPIFDQDGHYKGLVDGTVYQHLHNYLVLLNNQIKRDGLTDLGNRRTFDCIMKEWFDNKLQYSIILIDIDHFKTVNDTYGHLVGDDVLRHLSSMMKKLSGEEDLCFSYGRNRTTIYGE